MNTKLLAGLKHLWKVAFGDPDAYIDTFFAVAFSPDRCRYLMVDGKVVSALYWFDCESSREKLAYIYAVATLPEYRGQGLAARLLQETHVHLQALGYAGTILKPAAGLFPYYERLGYVTSGYVSRFDAEAGAVPIPIKELSPTGYAALRRSFLPEDGIRQEGVTLEFLHTFARFFAAKNAIVCVARQEPAVFEYLGDPAAAPGILAALGIPQATLQTVGNAIPYAMYHPLNCTKTPGYLGISLE